MSSVDWEAWYLDTLDALIKVIEDGSVSWATDPDGNPWVLAGDRNRTGLEFPACFIPSFSKRLDEGESSARSELEHIEATLLILDEGDPATPEANLRQAVAHMAQVENDLYDNRSLQVDLGEGAGTQRYADRVTVTNSTPFAAPNDSGGLVGAEVQLDIQKEADHW